MAPKTRFRPGRNGRTESRSITGTSQRSTGLRSTTGSKGHGKENSRKVVYLRGLSRLACGELANPDDNKMADHGFKVWVDPAILTTKPLKNSDWITVMIAWPMNAHAPLDQQQMQKIRDQEATEIGKPAMKVVAKLEPWEDAPDSNHCMLSSALCASLGNESLVGGLMRLETAPEPILRSSVQAIKIFPFRSTVSNQSEGLRFGGETKASKEAAVKSIQTLYIREDGTGILQGPLTNGMILPPISSRKTKGWHGGLLRFENPQVYSKTEKYLAGWLHGSDGMSVELQQDIISPLQLSKGPAIEEQPIPTPVPPIFGRDSVIRAITSGLVHRASILVSGGTGCGKTALAQLIGHHLRSKNLYHVSYFNCRRLVTDEMRISAIKDILHRMFVKASWGSRLGGQALVILDDLDRLCPAETELQVGSENGRSRQLSELLCSIVHQYCGARAGTVLLATAQGKDELHSTVLGAHIVHEFISLKAPSKEDRRTILRSISSQNCHKISSPNAWANASSSEDDTSNEQFDDDIRGFPQKNTLMPMHKEVDFLEIACQTDGFMPGDLILLLSRTTNEALIRSSTEPAFSQTVKLKNCDFEQALKGFIPASLRNVALQSSSTTFDSIGGLHETRKILLETLQYPTTYAPIFAQCPLRLRSGLLLYGYPGCGKTLLASAVAGECGLNFISVKGPEILNKYIGASEKSVRDLFERAEAAKPCVLFFDEFDSIAPKRGHDSTGVTDRVVNQLLTQMDGAEGLSGVYVLAATSRPDLIDPALLRPGRLDKSIICEMPSEEERLDILYALSRKLHLTASVLDDDTVPSGVNLREVASRTQGYSGADLQAVMYNAHLEAIHASLRAQKTGVGNSHSLSEPGKERVSSSRSLSVIQFKFGNDESLQADQPLKLNQTQQASERAAVFKKLDSLKLARRKEKELRRGILNGGNIQSKLPTESDPNIVIHWEHLELSLATTKASIGTTERRKLEIIYREFLEGRDGDMPNGQGPTDVGARSTLM